MPLIINGQRVEDVLVENEFAGIKAYHEGLGNVSCCERDPEFRSSARDNILARVLLAQEANRVIEPTPDAEVEPALAKLMDEYGGKDWFFMRTGASEDQLPLIRRDIDTELRVQRMLDRLADEAGPPTEEQLRQHYASHPGDFMTVEEIRASHILKTARNDPKYETYNLMRDLRKQLQAGADFHALAQQHSDRADDNIDLGYFRKGDLAPEFETVVFSLAKGEISPVFATSFGLHLVVVTDRREPTLKPFDTIRDEVAKHYRDARKAERTRALVERLKAAATIEEIDPEAEAEQLMTSGAAESST